MFFFKILKSILIDLRIPFARTNDTQLRRIALLAENINQRTHA